MDVIAIISDGFNIYFPIAILAFCLATYFSLGSRLLSMIGFHQFVGDDEITQDLVNEGRDLIKRGNFNFYLLLVKHLFYYWFFFQRNEKDKELKRQCLADVRCKNVFHRQADSSQEIAQIQVLKFSVKAALKCRVDEITQ